MESYKIDKDYFELLSGKLSKLKILGKSDIDLEHKNKLCEFINFTNYFAEFMKDNNFNELTISVDNRKMINELESIKRYVDNFNVMDYCTMRDEDDIKLPTLYKYVSFNLSEILNIMPNYCDSERRFVVECKEMFESLSELLSAKKGIRL